MRDQKPKSHDTTLTLHAGAGHREIGTSVSSPPVLATSFFTHPDAVGFSANDLNEAAPHFYTRWSNPTHELLETRLAALDQELVQAASHCDAAGNGRSRVTGERARFVQ
jgi:cystathionine gamma-synthase